MTSTIKVNNIQNQCGANIIKENSNTITLGASGDTIALASGASQTGFGRTGTVDWQTGSIKTSTFTAVSGEGYFANTSGGAFTMNLPAGVAGAIVSVVDYTNTFQTNSLTISPNGTDKIAGTNANAILSTEGQSVTFVFIDSTEGWKNVQDSTSNVVGSAFISATGGTITTVCTNFKVHTFTSSGTFAVTGGSGPLATASYLVVAGGGGGGRDRSGGGGAGGFREGKDSSTPYTASPIAATSGLPLSPGSYPITVGAGAAGLTSGPASADAGTGGVSTFSTITSAGGGRGGSGPGPFSAGGNGGSGGGSDAYGSPSAPANMAAGSGNTPPVSPPQGKDGGVGIYNNPNGAGRGGGGGGATVAGTSSTPAGNTGGAGATTSINASPVAFAGGGGGSNCGPGTVAGGAGGGGTGAGGCGGEASVAGTVNRGGGGGAGNGGNGGNSNGKGGGSGIVIIRYKFQ